MSFRDHDLESSLTGTCSRVYKATGLYGDEENQNTPGPGEVSVHTNLPNDMPS